MSSKKRKRKPRARPAPAPPPPVAEEPKRRGFLSAGVGLPSPFPTLRSSVLRGVFTIGRSWLLLAVPFIVLLLAWVGLIASGLEATPNWLLTVFALPPMGAQFDIEVGERLMGVGTASLVVTSVLMLLRGIVLAVVTGLIVEALESARTSAAGLRRGLSAIPALLATNVLGLGIYLIATRILPGMFGPQIGVPIALFGLLAGVYFLVFVPVAAIRERRPLQQTLARATRAARLPAGRHLLMAMTYFIFGFFLVQGFAPGGARITANPTTGQWAYILVGAYIQLAFVAAFAYRWIEAEADIPEAAPRRRR